jgi:hypothetical protein
MYKGNSTAAHALISVYVVAHTLTESEGAATEHCVHTLQVDRSKHIAGSATPCYGIQDNCYGDTMLADHSYAT